MSNKLPRKRRIKRTKRHMKRSEKERLASFVKSQPRFLGDTFVIVHKRHACPPFMFLTNGHLWPGYAPMTRSLSKTQVWVHRSGPWRYLRNHPWLKSEWRVMNLSPEQATKASQIKDDGKTPQIASQAA